MDDAQQPSTDWRLAREDCIRWQGSSSAEEAFTRIYIRYADPTTGEEGVVHAEKAVDEGFPLLERIVPKDAPGAPLTRREAQQLADEAVSVLGGVPIQRYWVTIEAGKLIEHRDAVRRPANQMQPRDSVSTAFLRKTVLYVSGVTTLADGELLINLADVDLDARLDMEIKLLALEQR